MKHLSSLINPEFARQTQQLARIDHVIKSALPVAGHPHIQVAHITDKELVIITDSPAWSTRLRLHTQDMLYMLSQHTDLDISSIRIRLLKNHQPAKPKQPIKQPIRLSRSSAQLISQIAETITDPELKHSLEKLAKRTKPPT